MPLPAPVTVVIATRNRATELLRTLTRLLTLPEHPPIVVVDNGSTDGTSRLVRAHHPGVQVVRLASNHGGAARTVGARLGGSPYVAFCDDDSWWAPGALRRAAELLGRHRRLAVLAARVLVGEVVAYHQPSPGRDPSGRRRTQVRNARWPGCAGRSAEPRGGPSTWQRRPRASQEPGRACCSRCSACRGSCANAAPSTPGWRPRCARWTLDTAVEGRHEGAARAAPRRPSGPQLAPRPVFS